MGSFKAYPAFTIIAAVSLVFAGLYGLILIHKALFGEPNAEAKKQHYTSPLKDLSLREVSILMICVIGLLWLGLYPQTFLDVSHSKHAMVSQ